MTAVAPKTELSLVTATRHPKSRMSLWTAPFFPFLNRKNSRSDFCQTQMSPPEGLSDAENSTIESKPVCGCVMLEPPRSPAQRR